METETAFAFYRLQYKVCKPSDSVIFSAVDTTETYLIWRHETNRTNQTNETSRSPTKPINKITLKVLGMKIFRHLWHEFHGNSNLIFQTELTKANKPVHNDYGNVDSFFMFMLAEFLSFNEPTN